MATDHYGSATRLINSARGNQFGEAALVDAQLAQAHATLALVDTLRAAGEKGTRASGEPTPSDLTIYRAEHESIVMGLYQTRAQARAHCEDLVRREVGDSVFLGWVPDESGDDVPEELCTGYEIHCTGYVVTPLTVAAEYDREADE
ncbi:hypothetical protein ACFWZY_01710 [Streptomyces sp. NPDC058992]|uniref:hypothetical protein n=1 Tax=Streptomyces sp. NPDC058992 TaxID=3346688 RepID=UPI00368DD573